MGRVRTPEIRWRRDLGPAAAQTGGTAGGSPYCCGSNLQLSTSAQPTGIGYGQVDN